MAGGVRVGESPTTCHETLRTNPERLRSIQRVSGVHRAKGDGLETSKSGLRYPNKATTEAYGPRIETVTNLSLRI
jgi:hypothetical protein